MLACYWVVAVETSSVRVGRYAHLFSVWRCVERKATAVLWIDVSATEPDTEALARALSGLVPGDVALSKRLQWHLAAANPDRLDLPNESGGFDVLQLASLPAESSLPDPCRRFGLEDLAVAVALCRVTWQSRARAALPEAIRQALRPKALDPEMPTEWPTWNDDELTDLCTLLFRPKNFMARLERVHSRQIHHLRAWVVGQSAKHGRILSQLDCTALLGGCRLTRIPHAPRGRLLEASTEATPRQVVVARALVHAIRGDRGVPFRIAQHLRPRQLHPVTLLTMEEREILKLPNVGKKSVRGLREWVHRRSADFGYPLTLPEVRELLDGYEEGDEERRLDWGAGYLLDPEGPQLNDLPVALLTGLDVRIRNWMSTAGVERIGDLAFWSSSRLAMEINLGEVSIMKLRATVQPLQRMVAQLAANEGEVSGTELVRRIVPAPTLLGCVEHFLAGLQDAQRVVLTERTLAWGKGATYRSLENQLGLGQGRASYLEIRARQRLLHDTIFAGLTDPILFALRRRARWPVNLRELERADPWFAGVSDRPEFFARVLENIDSEHRVAMDAELESACVTLAVAVTGDSLDREFLLAHCRAQLAYSDEVPRRSAAEQAGDEDDTRGGDSSGPTWIRSALSELGVAELTPLMHAWVEQSDKL